MPLKYVEYIIVVNFRESSHSKSRTSSKSGQTAQVLTVVFLPLIVTLHYLSIKFCEFTTI